LETVLERQNFRDVDSFIQKLDDFEIIVKHNPSSQKQVIIADKLSVAITLYRQTTRQLKTMLKGKEIKDTHVGEWQTKNDRERKQIEEVLTALTPEGIDKAWDERYDAAAQLRLCMTQAKTHGMVHPGSAVLKKLKQCRDENKRLNKELVLLGFRNEQLKKNFEGLLKLYPDARKRLLSNE